VKSSHTTHVVFQLANTYERCDIGTASIDRSSEGSGKSTGGVRAVAAAGAGAGSTATHAAAGGAERWWLFTKGKMRAATGVHVHLVPISSSRTCQPVN
jgi:hypothetical protein